MVHNIEDYGAVSGEDSSEAIHSALAAAGEEGGGEVLVPKNGVYLTSPLNVTTNVVLRVEGNLTGLRDEEKYPVVDLLPSYSDSLDAGGGLTSQHRRRHPLIWSVNATNITICGSGIIDGSGSYWLEKHHKNELHVGRPHLMEIMHGRDVTIAGPNLTLLNSGFWTLHPVYCNNVHIHHINIIASECETWGDLCNPNIDGIDVDSCQNVLIENNYISVGDDHVTVLAGRGEAGRLYNMPSKNVTVRNNILGTGMGLSIGSSVSGGVEDVLYFNNTMHETREQWGQGVHLKTRIGIGGYVKNVVWDSNVYFSTGTEAILIETDYQSDGSCDGTTCTRVEGIVLRNLVFHNSSTPGRIVCSEKQPCSNITFENVQINGFVRNEWGKCDNVVSSTFTNVMPKGLAEMCGNNTNPHTPDKHSDGGSKKRKIIVTNLILGSLVLIGVLYYFRDPVRDALKVAWEGLHRYFHGSEASGDVREPLLDREIVFETPHVPSSVLL